MRSCLRSARVIWGNQWARGTSVFKGVGASSSHVDERLRLSSEEAAAVCAQGGVGEVVMFYKTGVIYSIKNNGLKNNWLVFFFFSKIEI